MALVNALLGATKIGYQTLTDESVQYTFEVYPLRAKVFGVNAVYAFVSSFGQFPIKYIGKADVLSERLSGHDRMLEAQILGADELWIHIPQQLDRIGHEEAERRLIRAYRPPLNKHFT